MIKCLIIYYSKYGSTAQYATWLSESLNCEVVTLQEAKHKDLSHYECIIYGTALYAGRIDTKGIFSDGNQKLVVFTVGLSNPQKTDYSEIIAQNFKDSQKERIKFFHLRGSINYPQLKFIDKTLMFFVKKFKLDKIPESKRDDEVQSMIDSYGKEVDFTSRETLKPLIDYVSTL